MLHALTDESQDLTPARILKEPVPAFPVEHQMGPVMVTVDYRIDPACAAEFAALMRGRASRLQKGALSWGLFQDTSEPVITLNISSTNRGLIICGALIASPRPTPNCASDVTRFTPARSHRR